MLQLRVSFAEAPGEAITTALKKRGFNGTARPGTAPAIRPMSAPRRNSPAAGSSSWTHDAAGPGAADRPADTIKKYWADFAGTAACFIQPRQEAAPAGAVPASFSGARQVAATEDLAAAKLRQELAAAREAGAKAAADVAVLQARITRLEAQLAAQSKAGQVAVREARGRWTGGGFVGGSW